MLPLAHRGARCGVLGALEPNGDAHWVGTAASDSSACTLRYLGPGLEAEAPSRRPGAPGRTHPRVLWSMMRQRECFASMQRRC